MSHVSRFLMAFLVVIFTLQAAAPAFATIVFDGPERLYPEYYERRENRPALHIRIGQSFVRGAKAVGSAVNEWVRFLAARLGFGVSRTAALGDICDEKLACAEGLACMNVCLQDDCAAYEKRCVQAPSRVPLLAAYAPCSENDLCEKDTVCTQTCPDGVTCAVRHRCVPAGFSASDCKILPAPPGGTAWRGRCTVFGSCSCRLEEIQPAAPRVACSRADIAGAGLICPQGTAPACTQGACGVPGPSCTPRTTCLTAPEAGGTCFEDRECAAADCGEAQPFCDAGRCRCRRMTETTIACTSPSDCGSISCTKGEQVSCLSGECGCAAMPSDACERVEDCSTDCPSGYAAACASNRCVCQRTTQNVPLACQSVADCGGVSCPQGYDKTCRENVCACIRAVVP